VPVGMIVLSSFKQTADIFTYPPTLVFAPTLEHYETLWEKWPDFFLCLRNSAVIAVCGMVLTVLASALAGYVYSRYRGTALASSAVFLVAIRLLPPIVITLPLYPVVDFLKLSDSYTLLILLYATFFVSLGTMILKTFIDSIPEELDQAAIIDGASEWQILWRIIAPLSAQGAVAASIFVFVYAWNEYLRVHLHDDAGQDRAGRDQRDDGEPERRRLGPAVRGRDRSARAGRDVRRPRAEIPDCGPDRGIGEGMSER
jgi:multiple sugar transport system permease protein